MAEPTDMIVPMLREMRAESVALLRKLEARLDAVEGKLGAVDGKIDALGSQQKSFRQALHS